MSETFAIVWRRWVDVPVPEAARRSWTFRTAHNVMAHHVRSQVRRGLLFRRLPVGDAVVADPADAMVGDDSVACILAMLPHAEREAMALVVLTDMSPTQAAFVLGCSTTALTSRLTRARKRLEARLSAASVSIDQEVR